MKRLALAFAAVGLTAGPAVAFQCPQCPLLIKQVSAEADTRFDIEVSSRLDSVCYTAKGVVAEAAALHERGKDAEALEKIQEAFALMGLALQRP